jgi:hypothetical protein
MEESKAFILIYLLSQCSDFANEIADLQHLAAKLSGETGTVTIEFSPKYHCAITGEGIEFCWGFAKKLQRRLPIKDRRKVEGFIKSVKCCLKRVTPVRTRQFARRARKYMLAYHQIGQNPGEGAASRDQIDAIVDDFYATPPSTTSKRKRKNARPRFMVQPSDQEQPRETLVGLFIKEEEANAGS